VVEAYAAGRVAAARASGRLELVQLRMGLRDGRGPRSVPLLGELLDEIPATTHEHAALVRLVRGMTQRGARRDEDHAQLEVDRGGHHPRASAIPMPARPVLSPLGTIGS
jgi:hypothetical protein